MFDLAGIITDVVKRLTSRLALGFVFAIAMMVYTPAIAPQWYLGTYAVFAVTYSYVKGLSYKYGIKDDETNGQNDIKKKVAKKLAVTAAPIVVNGKFNPDDIKE